MDSTLATFVSLADELLGPDLLAALLFGSRARGDAHPTSDYDVLLITRREVTDAEQMQLVLGVTGPVPVNFQAHTEEEVLAELEQVNVALMNMLTEGQWLRGAVPQRVRLAQEAAVKAYGLAPWPAIAKGVWVADRDLPARVPRKYYLAAHGALVQTGSGGDDLQRQTIVDDLLRSLLSMRVQGHLGLDRTRLLSLLGAFVLAPAEVQQVRGLLSAPAELDAWVADRLSRRYGNES